MPDPRSSILARIRLANGRSVDATQADTEWRQLERGYQSGSGRSRGEVVELLMERLRQYDTDVHACTYLELSAVLAGMFNTIGCRRIAIPLLDANWDLPSGYQYLQDNDLSLAELNQVDAVLTGCTLAIAETGTLVLQSGPNQGRRALTLVPDVHVCLVPTSSIVETVPEAFARLQQTADLPTTFVSGPSATADIEMTRVKGVHGPRFLHVLLLSKEGDTISSVK